MHEASFHEKNCFITLTYNNENLPIDGSLNKEHFQLFIKRYRKWLSKTGQKIRYYHCGEYGAKLSRPHYHACIFGHDFEDKEVHSVRDGTMLYKSKKLSELWSKGFVTIGEVNFNSAAYVARYILKKQNGKNAEQHYKQFDQYTGEIYQDRNLQPEYTTMSRNKGIGHKYIEKYLKQTYAYDEVVVKGKSVKPPRYYDQQLQLQDPKKYEHIKKQRIKDINKEDNTPDRLKTKEIVKRTQIKKLKRSIED